MGFKEGKPFVFAGLWKAGWFPRPGRYRRDDRPIRSSPPRTGDRADTSSDAGHVDPADYEVWLTGDPSEAANVIRAFPPCDMAFYRVSTRVNNVRNDDESCVEPLKKTS